jgi:hypothetical protein
VTEKNMDKLWESWFTRGLADLVRIESSTPASDPDFMTNGKTELQVEIIDDYIEKLEIVNVKRHFIPHRDFGEEEEEEEEVKKEEEVNSEDREEGSSPSLPQTA